MQEWFDAIKLYRSNFPFVKGENNLMNSVIQEKHLVKLITVYV